MTAKREVQSRSKPDRHMQEALTKKPYKVPAPTKPGDLETSYNL